MVPRRVPQPVHPDVAAELQRRWRRAWPLLILALVLLPLANALPSVWAVVSAFTGGDVSLLLAIPAAGVSWVPPVLLWRSGPTLIRTPDRWPGAAAWTAFGTAAGLLLAVWQMDWNTGPVFPPFWFWLGIAPAIGYWSGRAARQRFVYPLAPLGASSFRQQFDSRVAVGKHGQIAGAEAFVGTLTLEPEVLRWQGFVRTSMKSGRALGGAELRIPLRSVREIEVRPGAGGQELLVEDGTVYRTGPAVALRLRSADEEWLVPASQAELLGELVAWRVRLLTGEFPAMAGHTVDEPPQDLAAEASSVVRDMGIELPPSEGPPISGVAASDVLPAGPGMALRLAVAGCAVAIGAIAVPVAGELVRGAVFRNVTGADTEAFGRNFLPIYLPLMVLGCFLAILRWRRPAMLFAAVSIPLAPWAFAQVAGETLGFDAGSPGALGIVALLAGWLAALLGYLALRLPGRDLAASTVRLSVGLREDFGRRLQIDADRVVLRHGIKATGSSGRIALRLAKLKLVQPGSLATDGQWPLPDGVRLPVPAGPALRLAADSGQWVVPLRHPARVAALLAARAEVAEPAPAPPTLAQWRESRSEFLGELRGQRRQRRKVAFGGPQVGQSTGSYLAFGLLGAVFTGFSVVVPILGGMLEFSWTVTLFFGVPTLLALTRWLVVRAQFRGAELDPLPPGAPPWGDIRPDHAPLPGWQLSRAVPATVRE